jgi:hypothetical protein
MIFLILFAVPAVVALGFYLFGGKKITPRELILMLGVQIIVAGISAIVVYCNSTLDVETLNGHVVRKASEHVSCEHDYECNCSESCSTDSDGEESCTQTCMTCYEHSYDVDWAVYTSFSERIEIDREDRQGLDEPPRWTLVKVGEPVSRPHIYTNYIKAAPDSLFRRTAEDVKNAKMPAYPTGVYDYYRYDHLYPIGVNIPDGEVWNSDLAALNDQYGSAKQINILFVPVYNQPHEWYYDLERSWLGGKKNDLIVVASLAPDGAYRWVEIMTWSTEPMVKIALRDALMSQEHLDRLRAIPAISDVVQRYWVRRPMKDFEYLKASVTPTPVEWVICLIVGLLTAFAVAVYCHKNDVFNEEW